MAETTLTVPAPGAVPVEQLRALVEGAVLVPGDAGYEEARTVFLGVMDQRPAAVVQAAALRDVVEVVTLARDTGLPLAVRSGGHSVFCLVDGGLVLDLSQLRDLRIDPATRTAWVGAGVTTGEYGVAAAEHGLATGFGDTGSVGVAGITLGGGIGYLVRKHGLTIDDLLAAEIVTADGAVRRVDATSEPDLFWAVRGGGGNFGVVTRLRFRLHELPEVTGGPLVLPATPEVITGFLALAAQAPEELTAIVNVMKSPPMPFVPAELHGTPIVMATIVYAGVGEEAEAALAPFRQLSTPIADMVGPMPYPGVFPPEREGFHPVSVARNTFLDRVDAEDAEAILDRVRSSSAVLPAVQLRVLGGAMARVPADATAFPSRDRAIMAQIAAIYADRAEAPLHTRWADELLVTLQKGVPGVYVNFLSDDTDARIGEAYPEATWARLRAIKRRYDPTNVFRVNTNIPPADDEG